MRSIRWWWLPAFTLTGTTLSVRMVPSLRSFAVLMAGVAAVTAHAVLPPPVPVVVPSLETGANGMPTMIPALLFRPLGATANAGVPLVVALHGCGGMFGPRSGREPALSERFSTWTEQFLADGYAVLWPDSFTPRGHREICTTKMGDRTITAASRRLDVLGALEFAAKFPGIDAQRIAVVGWSHGGSTTLAAINSENSRVARFRARAESPPFFRAAVALYPGCSTPLRDGPKWRPATTASIHIGASDDWTPAAPCVALAESMREAGQPLTVRVYPDSYHGFDAPAGRIIVRRDVPNGVNPGQGVTQGPNPAARAAASDSVRAFLREQLAPTTATKAHAEAPAPAASTAPTSN